MTFPATDGITDRLQALFAYDASSPLIFSSGLFLFLFAGFLLVYSVFRRAPMARIVYVIAFSLYFYYKSSGIYLLLLWRQNRRSWLFYTCAVSLFIIPFFKVGQGCDFCMRVSIPAIFILMTLCARYFIALVGTKWRDGTLAQHAVTILLAATLLIGACTPAMEIYRGICHVAKEGTFCLENEEPYTLADRPVSLNFETQNCENKLFFTYFAK